MKEVFTGFPFISSFPLAAKNGREDIVELLLEAGADPNVTTTTGRTPTGTVMDFGKVGQADPMAINNDGRTPFDLAIANGHTDVAALLRRRS